MVEEAQIAVRNCAWEKARKELFYLLDILELDRCRTYLDLATICYHQGELFELEKYYEKARMLSDYLESRGILSRPICPNRDFFGLFFDICCSRCGTELIPPRYLLEDVRRKIFKLRNRN